MPDPHHPSAPPFRVVRLDDLDHVPVAGGDWRPIRRPLGITAFGINASSAEQPGDNLIEDHNEVGSGAGRHEEIYLVVRGHAAFTVGGEEVDAPAGTFVFVRDPAVQRSAVAREPETSVVVVGGRTGAGLPISPFEHWFAAEPSYRAGDYGRAIEIASAGLADYPDHPTLNYQLACYHALAGDRAVALEHLRRAYAGEPSLSTWAADDEDLASIRDDPSLGP